MGLQDIIQTVNDFQNGSGSMLNRFTFGPASNPWEYDPVMHMRGVAGRMLVDKYYNSMARDSVSARIKALSGVSGSGAMGTALGVLMRQNSSAGMSAIGHFGGDEALKSILTSANGFAHARGIQVGGVMDPVQLNRNFMMAASQGAMAYNNNFLKDGTINASQTHGISLPAAAAIINGTLSSRSQIRAWAENAKSDIGAGLTEKEIDNLAEGRGVTEKAVRSLNDHVKKFTEQLNGMVSSMSKITKDYGEAISFLQKLTGGKLYEAGGDAEKARKRAGQIAASMRIAAADAGIDPQALYATAGSMSVGLAGVAGLSDKSIVSFGGSKYFSQIGSLEAIAVAKYTQSHPGMSEESLKEARAGIHATAEGYVGGDADRMNAYAAYLKHNGIGGSDFWREYERANREGDAERQQRLLEKFGKGAFERFTTNDARVQMVRQSSIYGQTYKDLASETIAVGIGNERRFNGKMQAFEDQLELLAMGASGGNEEKADRMFGDWQKSLESEALSISALKAAGLSDAKAKELQKKMAGKSLEEISGAVSDAGGSREAHMRAARKSTADRIRASLGNDQGAAAALENFNRQYGSIDVEISQKDIDSAKEKVLQEESTKRLEAEKLKLAGGSESYAHMTSLSENRFGEDGLLRQSLLRRNGLMFSSNDLLDRRLARGFNLDMKRDSKKFDSIKNAYIKAKHAGLSEDEALKAAAKEGYGEKGNSVLEALRKEGKFGEDFEIETFGEVRSEAVLAGGLEGAANQLSNEFKQIGLGEFLKFGDSEKASMYKKFMDLKKKNPGADDATLQEQAIEATIMGAVPASMKDRLGESIKKSLESNRLGIMRSLESADRKFIRSGIVASKGRADFDGAREVLGKYTDSEFRDMAVAEKEKANPVAQEKITTANTQNSGDADAIVAGKAIAAAADSLKTAFTAIGNEFRQKVLDAADAVAEKSAIEMAMVSDSQRAEIWAPMLGVNADKINKLRTVAASISDEDSIKSGGMDAASWARKFMESGTEDQLYGKLKSMGIVDKNADQMEALFGRDGQGGLFRGDMKAAARALAATGDNGPDSRAGIRKAMMSGEWVEARIEEIIKELRNLRDIKNNTK